ATGDAIAVGTSSGLTVPVASANLPVNGAKKTLADLPQVTATVVPLVAPPPIVPSATNVPMLLVHLQEATVAPGKLTALDLTALVDATHPPANDANDVAFVKLWLESGAQHQTVLVSDTLVGLTKYFSDGGVAAFGGLSVAIAKGGSVDLLVTYDMS